MFNLNRLFGFIYGIYSAQLIVVTLLESHFSEKHQELWLWVWTRLLLSEGAARPLPGRHDFPSYGIGWGAQLTN